MKIKHLFYAATLFAAVFSSCTKETPVDPSTDPFIKLDTSKLSFEANDSQTKTFQLISNRSWELKNAADYTWLTVTPTSGDASDSWQKITIAAEGNTGVERTANLNFSTGSASTSLLITQAGSKAKGDGSKDNPFSVAEAIVKAKEIGQEAPSTEYYYIKGYITSIKEISTSYGNGTFYICDAKTGNTDSLYCYQVKYVGGASFTSADQIKVGDEVVMYAQIYNYKGNTPETSGQGASYIYTLNGQGGGGEPGVDPKGDGSKDNPYNVAGAIVKAKEIGQTAPSTEYYYIKGYITSIKEVSTSYGNATFYIGDSKGATSNLFYCFQVKNVGQSSFTSADQINVDDEVVMYAQIYNFKGNTPETSGKGASYIYSNNGQGGGGEHKTITTEKVADAIAAATGDTVILNNALVVATAKTGYLVTDSQNSGNILVYQGTASTDTPAAVGDKVNIKSVRGDYSSMPQLNTPATTVVSSGTQITWPTPDDITATFDSFESATVKYISYKGKLSVSGNYYNIAVDGATKIGSILPSAAAEAYIGLAGVTFKGYYLYTSSSKYLYTIFTEAQLPSDYLTVNPTTTNVAATAGTTEITVSSDQSWTAASDNSNFTVNPASGSGNGTVTVTYTANSEFKTRTANITFSVGGTTRATTVITQAAAQDPSATTVELTNNEIVKTLTDLGSSSTAYTEVTYKSATGDWVANSSPSKSNKWIQIRDTKASYLKSPVFASNIEKIEIRTDANKGTQIRSFYAVPSSTQLPTSDKSYADDENKAVLANAYGKVQTQGVTAGTAGEVGESVTITFTENTKDFMILTTCEGSSSSKGATYINSIKVYLKNN